MLASFKLCPQIKGKRGKEGIEKDIKNVGQGVE